MTFTDYVHTNLTPAEQSKVPAGNYTPLLANELIALVESLRPGDDTRVYGYLEPLPDESHGQIIRIASTYYLDKYAGRISFAWSSSTLDAIKNMIKRA